MIQIVDLMQIVTESSAWLKTEVSAGKLSMVFLSIKSPILISVHSGKGL